MLAIGDKFPNPRPYVKPPRAPSIKNMHNGKLSDIKLPLINIAKSVGEPKKTSPRENQYADETSKGSEALGIPIVKIVFF